MNLTLVKLVSFLFIAANVHALWELEIEGKTGSGWANNLPCWRWNRFWAKLLGGKPMTGYHFYMMIMFQLIFHIPFIFIDWSLKKELITQGLFMWYFICEDILWFIHNPAYTLKRFRKHKIPWHKRWFLGLPFSYWVSGIIGTILLILGGK